MGSAGIVSTGVFRRRVPELDGRGGTMAGYLYSSLVLISNPNRPAANSARGRQGRTNHRTDCCISSSAVFRDLVCGGEEKKHKGKNSHGFCHGTLAITRSILYPEILTMEQDLLQRDLPLVPLS